MREALNATVRKYGIARHVGARAVSDFEARAAALLGVPETLAVSHESQVLPLLPTWRLVSHVRGVRPVPDAIPAATPEDAEAALAHAGMHERTHTHTHPHTAQTRTQIHTQT